MTRLLLRRPVLIIALVITALGVGGCGLFSPLPEETTVAERLAALPIGGAPIERPVTIYWNERLVPFVEAQTDEDLAVTLGIIHAHLRLAQMEAVRRASQGRIAEMAGPLATNIDIALRTLDLGRAVPEILESMPSDTRRWLEAFVRGVNHVIAALPDTPHEFKVLGIEPEPWTAEDVLTMGRLASIDVNWFVWFQLLQYRNRADWPEIWTRLLDEGTASMPSYAQDETRDFAFLRDLLMGLSRSGSNSAAVSGARTESGGAMLASDPHLGIMLPSLWLIAGVKSPSYHAVGLMPPGLPFFALGRNADIAWGGTNLRAASSDLFDVSKLPVNEIETREERIAVRWWLDKTVTVRDTRFGPIITDSEVIDGGDAQVALRWIGHAPSDELTAMLRVNRARDWNEFRTALDGFSISAQNMIYADAKGNIGHVMAAHLPKRTTPRPRDLVLAPEEASAWETILRARDLPVVFNPPEGFIASANNRGGATSIPIGYFFSSNDRVERMSEQLGRNPKVTFSFLSEMQRDVFRASASRLRNLIVLRMEALPRAEALSGAKLRLVEEIVRWDGHYLEDSAGAAAFESFLFHFTEAFYENGELDIYSAIGRPLELIRMDVEAASDEKLTRAIDRALGPAAESVAESRTWGERHRLVLAHPLSFMPVIGGRYKFGEYPVAGSSSTLMKTAHSMSASRHNVRFGSNARHISDLSDLDANFFVLLGGQDGRLGSAALTDQFTLWRAGEYIQMPLRLETVRRLFPLVTRLTP